MGPLHLVPQPNFHSFPHLLVETQTRNVRNFPPGLSLSALLWGRLSDSEVRSINVRIATNCIAPRATRKIKRDVATIIPGALCDSDNLEHHSRASCLPAFLSTHPSDGADVVL